MSQRRATKIYRCLRCRIHRRWCFCEHLVQLNNHTKVSIILHQKETYLSSNTAQLAHLTLQKTQLLVRGNAGAPLSEQYSDINQWTLPEHHHHLYLYPEMDAPVLDAEFAKTLTSSPLPLHIIIPDGSWKQAKKMKKREPLLQNPAIRTVRLLPTLPSQYKLRRQNSEEGLCTYEALALALGLLEGTAIAQTMLQNLQLMVERVLISRAVHLQ